MYINYKRWNLDYNPDTRSFSAGKDGYGTVITDARVTAYTDGCGNPVDPSSFRLAAYHRCGCAVIGGGEDVAGLDLRYDREEPNCHSLHLNFRLADDGFFLGIGGDATACVTVEGHLRFGNHDQKETRACAIGRPGPALRCGQGPAATLADNALFDPDTDTAVVFSAGGRFVMKYDWEADCYAFRYTQTRDDFQKFIRFHIVKDVYENIFHMDYKRYNKNGTFKTPPVGWMTWYAVQFHAGEDTVLENTAFQEQYLKPYGADTIWVDWEWYHRNFMGVAAPDVSMLSPDPVSYPHGLKYVADKIKEAGFLPALWVGPTNDPTENAFIKEHPEIVMKVKSDWCGNYYMDPTHPNFVEGLLPKMINQCLSWGYKAFKWDCMPHTTQLCDECHDTLYEKGLSTREAMLVSVRKMRELIGEDFDLMYCASLCQRDLDMACTLFDASRIGNDVFQWPEYLRECVDKLYKYYSLHNTVIRCDPDNVILREKFNTIDQARSRASITALAGLPYTFGDELAKLPEERVEIIRRSIPPIPDVHPLDIRTTTSDRRRMILSLTAEKPFGTRHVFGIVNLTGEPMPCSLDLENDLFLETDGKPYLVYDFWNDVFVGRCTDKVNLNLRPHETAVLSIVKETPGVAQVLSTSRHLSQGILDLKDVRWDAENVALRGTSEVVGGEPYRIIVSSVRPDNPPAWYCNQCDSIELTCVGRDIWAMTYHPKESGLLNWSIGFINTILD